MKKRISLVARCTFMSVTLISFFTLLLFNTSCSSSSDLQQLPSASNQNLSLLPSLEETKSDGNKVYLDSVEVVNKEDQAIQNLLSSGLNVNIGANDVLVKYTLRNEMQKGQPSTKQSYIARYIPTGYGDYRVSKIQLPLATVNSDSSSNAKPVWVNEGMLSSKKNSIECDVLKTYRKIERKI